MFNIWPVTYSASERNIAASAISFSVPILPNGTEFIMIFFCSVVHSVLGGSRMAPGAIAFTLISGANSFARDLVRVCKPDFAAR